MKKRALIVDDQHLYRDMLKTILKLRNFEFDEAADGIIALTKLKENNYDIIFSDVSMPNMNGFELLSRIRRNPQWEKMPVVMLTSEDRPEDVAKGKKLGCNYYMIKPFNSEKLNDALQTVGLR